jgi:hypothetical protein
LWPTSARRCRRPASTFTTTIRRTGTVEAATKAGATVRRELHQGKGRVVRRMFTDIDADIYVLVDGDATYDAPSAPKMIEQLVADRLDMVCAVRVDREEAAYRLGHRAGNRMLTGFVAMCLGSPSPTCCRATGCSLGAS